MVAASRWTVEYDGHLLVCLACSPLESKDKYEDKVLEDRLKSENKKADRLYKCNSIDIFHNCHQHYLKVSQHNVKFEFR